MSTTAKAQMTMIEIKDILTKRLPSTWTLTAGKDSLDNPTLLVSADATPAAGEQVFFIRCKAIDTLAVDVLGLAQKVFTPHVLQIAMELSAVAGVPIATTANQIPVLGELFKRGMKVEVWHEANLTVPSVASVATGGTATLVATFNQNLYHPLAGQ